MSDALPLPPRPNLEQYRNLARDLQRATRAADPEAFQRWASRWPRDADRLERRWREFVTSHGPAEALKLTDAQFFIAREHGFASWPVFAAHLQGLGEDSSPTALFESAVDAIVAGDADRLSSLLRAHPELARARSTRDHRSTLLHYVSANGVEDFRQITPANIVSMTDMLLAAGADVNAASEAYGGGSTALGLVATSVHPERAGVQMDLLETLLRHGARIDGEQAGNHHGLVLGCLANGQPRAARFFADRGAPLNLIEAAGLGLMDRVSAFFDDAGRPRDGVTDNDLGSALQYAAGYGHRDVVSFLLSHGANPGWADNGGQTPLHWATFGPHPEIARVLIEAGASVEARDSQFHATPLAWMVHAWAKSEDQEDKNRGQDLAALLVAAGAVCDLERFEPRTRALVRQDAGMTRALGLPSAGDSGASPAGSDIRIVALDIVTDELNLCSVSPDGRRVLAASVGNPALIFDARTGKRERVLDAATTNAWLACWTQNPARVLAGSRDRTIGFWDANTGERLCVLRGHTAQPRSADTNTAVTRALTGCSHGDTTLKFWDLRSGECLQTCEGHADGVYSVAFRSRADSDQAASGSRDTTIRLWDLATGRTMRVLTGHTYHVHSLAWRSDGRQLLSTSMDLRLWDPETGRCLRVFEGHTAVIRSVVWSADEKHALTASHDRTARLWELATGRCVRVFDGHDVGLIAASFSADGNRVLTCDWSGTIRETQVDS